MLVLIFLVLFCSMNHVHCDCYTLFSTENQQTPEPLPNLIQVEPNNIDSSWYSYWEFLTQNNTPVACLLIKGLENSTLTYSAFKSCNNVTDWENYHTWPKFKIGGSIWHNRYTIFITTNNNSFNVSLNQRETSKLIQYTKEKVIFLNKINMTLGGPQVGFHNLEMINNDTCLALKECSSFNGWSFLSLSPIEDIVQLSSHEEQILVRVTYSFCFPSYNWGLYFVGNSSRQKLDLRVTYSKVAKYHMLVTTINSHIIQSVTKFHNGLDCSREWYYVAVKGANIIVNCGKADRDGIIPTPPPTHGSTPNPTITSHKVCNNFTTIIYNNTKNKGNAPITEKMSNYTILLVFITLIINLHLFYYH